MSDHAPNDKTTYRVEYETATFEGSHTSDTEHQARAFLETVPDWTHAQIYRQTLVADMEGE